MCRSQGSGGRSYGPQTFVAYETLPLFLIVETRIEAIVLLVGSIAAELVSRMIVDATPDLAATVARRAPFLLLGMYAPALVMILRRRNEGRVPSRIERLAAHLPTSLQGVGTV